MGEVKLVVNYGSVKDPNRVGDAAAVLYWTSAKHLSNNWAQHFAIVNFDLDQ